MRLLIEICALPLFLSSKVTPRVVQEVRDHFGCDQLEGAELEDQGGEGTALTHWEKRILEVGR